MVEFEVFAGHEWFILCVPINVYIDGVFVKCSRKILDCNRFLFSILIDSKRHRLFKKQTSERVFLCVLSLLSHKTNVLIFCWK